MCDLISQRPGVCLGLLGLSTFDAQAELQQSYSQTPVLCRMVWVLDRGETKIEPGMYWNGSNSSSWQILCG